jgi:hypothetical protein
MAHGETLRATGRRLTRSGRLVDVEIPGAPPKKGSERLELPAITNDVTALLSRSERPACRPDQAPGLVDAITLK